MKNDKIGNIFSVVWQKAQVTVYDVEIYFHIKVITFVC